MQFVFIDKNRLTKNLKQHKPRLLNNGQYIIRLNDDNEELLKDYIKYSNQEVRALDLDNVTSKIPERITESKKDFAISDNKTENGEILYSKIHGVNKVLQINELYEFTFQIPYERAYFQGAEIIPEVEGVANFDMASPLDLSKSIEQYGFDVNLGKAYKRESKYAARLPQGLILRCKYKNVSDKASKVGVNFLLHEIRK